MPTRARRIVFVIDDLGHGGAQRQLVLIASALKASFDPHVVVLSSVVDPHAAALRANGVPVVVVPRRHGMDAARVAAVARAVPDAGLLHGFLDASNAYAFLAARMIRRPVVMFLSSDRVTLHGTRAHAYKWMLRRADAVTVNSAAGDAFLTGALGLAPQRVVRVPNIVPEAPLPPLPTADARVIGCVGRLAAVKRFDAVIRALPAVRARVPGATLLIVGDGPERPALEALARDTGAGEAVTFAGALDRPLDAMAGMSCLVLASAFEGLPNAALEALSIGVPVVAAAAGDLGDVVEDGVTGVLAGGSSPDAIAGAVVRALESPGLRESARREGPRRMRERHSQDVVLRDLIGLYHRLIPPTK